MILFFNRPAIEQETVRRAYEFEIQSIEQESTEPNPYYITIHNWIDGREVWEAIEQAIQMAYE